MIIMKSPNHLFPFTVQRQFALLFCFAQVLYKAMLIEIGEKKLNLSIGVFQAGLLKLFTKVNGVVVPVKKSVGEMVDVFAKYGNFEMNIVIADGRVGKLTKNGYQDGIMGLISKNEIDITWIPLPMDTPNISGVFSHVVYEDEYRLASYYRPTTSISQDVIHTFTLFDPKIWFIALLLTYAIECLLNFKDTSFSNIFNLLISCTQRLPSLFFRQYFAKRSVARSITILGLLFLSIIFGASFNKDMIIGTSRETVNTLRDVVNRRMTPIFIDASSKYELFQLGETKDYADVYKLAIEKGSSQEYSADSISLFSRITPGHAIFASSKIRRVINLAHNLFRTDKSHILHWSDQTYHKVHQAYIITASPFKVEVRKRLMHLTGQFQQSDFIDRIQSKSVIEITKDLGVSLYEVYTAFNERNKKQTKNLHLYSPLSIVGFQSVRRYYCIFIKLSISIFTIEFILGKIFSNTRTKKIFFCRSRPFKL